MFVYCNDDIVDIMLLSHWLYSYDVTIPTYSQKLP